jgi:hypothetical protein
MAEAANAGPSAPAATISEADDIVMFPFDRFIFRPSDDLFLNLALYVHFATTLPVMPMVLLEGCSPSRAGLLSGDDPKHIFVDVKNAAQILAEDCKLDLAVAPPDLVRQFRRNAALLGGAFESWPRILEHPDEAPLDRIGHWMNDGLEKRNVPHFVSFESLDVAPALLSGEIVPSGWGFGLHVKYLLNWAITKAEAVYIEPTDRGGWMWRWDGRRESDPEGAAMDAEFADVQFCCYALLGF